MKKEIANVARSELIGLRVSVERRGAAFDDISGTVVDETKHTLVVERASGSVDGEQPSAGRVARRAREAVVPKKGQRFIFLVGDERFVVQSGMANHADATTMMIVDGDDIMFRPEDRTKKVRG